MDNSEKVQENLEEERVKICGEIANAQFNIMRRGFQAAAILAMGIGVPIVTPSMGATAEDVKMFTDVAIPTMAVTVPIALYKMHRLIEKKKELVSRLWEIDLSKSDSEAVEEGSKEEDKGMML